MGVLKSAWHSGARRLGLALIFTVLALSLAACGNEAANNNDFTVPALSGLTEVPAVAADAALRNRLLQPQKTEVTGQDLKVYTTNRSLADIQRGYSDEMTRRGWLDVSGNILGGGELGNRGLVQAFEKYVGGDPQKKQAAGIIALSPDEKNPLIEVYRSNGTIPKDSNVVLIILGAYGIGGPPVTPK